MISAVSEQKRALMIFLDFSDVTLVCEDKMKDWLNVWKWNLCDISFDSNHRNIAHRESDHRDRYQTVHYAEVPL